uniref:Putative endonuclease n=1 Tax=viral metagenome TaxID=1070528 RepID=A0A6H1ZKH0_9ZZZZ
MERMNDIECKSWCVYLILCEDGSYYAGVTNDLEARFATHLSGKGAKYTRAHKPLRVIAFRRYEDRAAAQKAEWAVKQLPKRKKIAFLASGD